MESFGTRLTKQISFFFLLQSRLIFAGLSDNNWTYYSSFLLSKDASRCYLKLLLLTVASGDGCNGEVIQSNRGLTMILDAILKTKSRTNLMDIINKNGLQMLHNIMKQYRKEFNKIPIIRKLLKVHQTSSHKVGRREYFVTFRRLCRMVQRAFAVGFGGGITTKELKGVPPPRLHCWKS